MTAGKKLLVLSAADVHQVLVGTEPTILDLIRSTYLCHRKGSTVLPQSSFLRFGHGGQDRIIALPARIAWGDRPAVTGVKWVSSFPGNVSNRVDRASAVIVLNDANNGQAEAFIEGSEISLWRTAASAALAAVTVHSRPAENRLGLVGCGRLAFEVVRFINGVFPHLTEIWVADTIFSHQQSFSAKITDEFEDNFVIRDSTVSEIFANCHLISMGTTAGSPHLESPSFLPGATILHLSLRDFQPETLLSCDNIVDDVEHVAREGTSIDLARQRSGTLAFVRCSLADVLVGVAAPRRSTEDPVVFSPFGLGILDLSVAEFVLGRASHLGIGKIISDFHPEPWSRP